MTGRPAPPDLRALLREVMFRQPEWYRAILNEIAGRLRATAMAFPLGVGDRMPPFVLPDTEGALVSSADLLARGPLVVYFVRGGWCPFCGPTLLALDAMVPEITGAGGRVVVLTADAAGFAKTMKESLGLRLDILSDVDCAVGLSFGIVYLVPQGYREALAFFGINLVERHAEGPGLLPMPATFIADADGRLRFAHVSGDVTDRAEPAILAEFVRAMRTPR